MGSETEFADDENSIFEGNLNRRGSLFLPRSRDRRNSGMSQCSFLSHLLLPTSGIKRSSIDSNGVVSLVGGNSLPSLPVGPPLPKLMVDMASTGDNVRKAHVTQMVFCLCSSMSLLFSFFCPVSLMFCIALRTFNFSQKASSDFLDTATFKIQTLQLYKS